MPDDRVVVLPINSETFKNIRVTYKNGSLQTIEAEYFGGIQNLEGFIGFWKNNEDNPYIVLSSVVVAGIEVLNDNS